MRTQQRAFSLIELVIALAILAAATTIAIRATSGLQDQARYQQTTRSLNDIQAAIVGPANQRNADGSALVTGFVADTGRLPQSYFFGSPTDPVVPGDPLNELTSNPNGIVAYRNFASNIDATVSVGVGWQGPYLHLGAGPTYIRDGWGNSLHAYDTGGNPITAAGTQIGDIVSFGSDNAADVNHGGSVALSITGYTNDVSIPNAAVGTSTGFNYLATINGQVTMDSGTDTVGGSSLTTGPSPINPTYVGTPPVPAMATPITTKTPVSVWVDYTGPDLTQTPNPVGDIQTEVATANSSGVWAVSYPSGPPVPYTGQFSIPQVTIGPRVLKVYLLPATVVHAGKGSDLTYFANYVINAATDINNPIYASAALNVTLVPGSQTINLVLPHYSPAP
jgi:prepilin-type N-terminal cleavage/methylation domain-containing protein